MLYQKKALDVDRFILKFKKFKDNLMKKMILYK